MDMWETMNIIKIFGKQTNDYRKWKVYISIENLNRIRKQNLYNLK